MTRESFRTKADSVEIQMDAPAAIVAGDAAPPARAPLSSSPSADELLERAAALGPMRMTWESIVLPADPILDEKRTPHVAERRARLTRVVKLTLGACLAVCVVALSVSAISAVSGSSDAPKSAASASIGIGKSVASKGVVPIEKMDHSKHGKAHRAAPTPAPAVTTAAIPKSKRR